MKELQVNQHIQIHIHIHIHFDLMNCSINLFIVVEWCGVMD